MMKLIKKFWGLCVFLATMAVVAVICFVAYNFLSSEVKEELHRKELIPTQAQVTRKYTKKDKQDKSKAATWIEVRLKNGRMHEVELEEGDKSVPGDWIQVEVPRHLVEGDDELSDVEKEEKKKKERDERKKANR